ncbi:MAG: histidine kinase dimerization/phospho-acceptor domain-containing protein, partial [Bacteroidota bacterium]
MKKIALGIVITVVLLTNQAGISQPLEQILQQSDLLMRTGQQTESLRLLRDGAITAQVQAAHPDLARLLLAEAENHYYFFHFDSAYTVAKEALTLAEKYQLEALLPAVYLQIGIAAMKSKYYEEALNYMSKAYTQAKEKGQELLILQADAYTEDISGIYNYHQGLLNTNVAQDAYERALKPLEASQDTSLYLSFLLRYADMYRNTGSLDSFQLLIQQAETTLENFQDIRAELKVLIMKSIHQSLLENWAAEEFYIRQALQKVLRLGTFPQLVQHYYFRLHFTYKERKQWNKAIEMLDSANLIETKLLLTGHDLYAQVYKEKGDDTKALEHYEKWMALRDSVLQTEKLSLITEWETKYDLQQKDLELEQQRSRQNLLIGGLVFLSFFGFLLFRAYRNKNKLNQELRSQKQKIEQQAEELRSLDRIKSNFFANVSHELRTPLTMILGPAELALKSKRLAQKEQKLIILVKKNSQKLLQLVNEILDLA